jgi:putative transposon-encoded protein
LVYRIREQQSSHVISSRLDSLFLELKYRAEKRQINVPDSKYQESTENNADAAEPAADALSSKVKFEIYGEEMIEKRVKSSGNSGRVYLPPNWVGHKVKIIRTD